MGTDLYVGFYDKGLSSLGEHGKLCFICADRWLQNQYGMRLRKKVSSGFNIAASKITWGRRLRVRGVDLPGHHAHRQNE